MDDTKYESMIDILWIAGLEAIAPVFAALGEEDYADYCNDVATSLRAHLDDFIIQSGEYGGMMVHSIKKDGTLADQAIQHNRYVPPCSLGHLGMMTDPPNLCFFYLVGLHPENQHVNTKVEQLVRLLYLCDDRNLNIVSATIKALLENK